MEETIKVLASGSSGNCYLVEGSDRLLIEAGIPLRKIRQGLDFSMATVAACLISHSHMDHAKSARDLLRLGIDCYMSAETAVDLGLFGEHRLHIVKPHESFTVGPWTIMGFPTVHDVTGAMGYLIAGEGVKIAYITDSAYSPFTFKDVTHYMVEINFDRQTLKENLKRGVIDSFLYQRLLRTHLGLDTALDFFNANDLAKVQEIHVLHMSDGNGNEARIKKALMAATGKPVFIH